jgi:hypothetical protein
MIPKTKRPVAVPAERTAQGSVGQLAPGDRNAIRQTAETLKAIASRLRPHELVAMLASHYSKATRDRPRVNIRLSATMPDGRQCVRIVQGG